MPTHSGQIAFVGGHKKSHETLPWDVAQREFEEETGHTREMLEYLGDLPLVFTAHRQPIIPVMAKLKISTDQFLTEVRSNGEWDEILAYPWRELLQEEKWDYAWRHGNDKAAVMFHPIKSGSYLSPGQSINSHLLWGATAHMIWSFLRLYFNQRT